MRSAALATAMSLQQSQATTQSNNAGSRDHRCRPPAPGLPQPPALVGCMSLVVLAQMPTFSPHTRSTNPPTTPGPKPRRSRSARGTLAAATGPDGLIYAIGGADANNMLATVEAYDPAADKWIAKAPLHTPRAWVAAVTGHDGLIYAIGGTSGPTVLNSIEIFNVTTDTWTTSPYTLPLPTCGVAAAVDPNGLIFAIGGDNLVNNDVHPQPQRLQLQPSRAGLDSSALVVGCAPVPGRCHRPRRPHLCDRRRQPQQSQ